MLLYYYIIYVCDSVWCIGIHGEYTKQKREFCLAN